MKHILELIVFLCGASLMVLELVGSRVLAPYIGTSTIVWTSLIGIILAFLSLGYWWGGKMADRGATYKKLALVILTSAFFVFVIIIINELVLSFIKENVKSIYAGAVIATMALFAVLSFLLGIVSPYAVRLKIKTVGESGRTVGTLYAISTIGSIVGTFAAGFLLIPFLGTIKILYFITVTLLLSSFLSFLKNRGNLKILIFFILLLIIIFSFYRSQYSRQSRIIDIDSQYNRIWIFTGKTGDKGRPVKVMTTDPYGTQSGMFLDKDDDLIFKYLKFYRLADHFSPDLKNSLLIGGAAYSYPKDYLRRHRDAELDVVEIDSKMTELAREHFNLTDDPRLKIYHQDGRVFLNNNQKEYDVIFVDAFTSRLSVPYQLATREAVERIYDSLDDEGVVLLNLISSFEGEKNRFLQAEYLTYKQVFPQVYLFKVDSAKTDAIQNIILAAFKSDKQPEFTSENEEFNKYLEKLWTEEIETDLPVLTDDYAPVDYYAMSMI